MKIDCQSCSLSEAVRKTLAQGRDSQILAACIAALGVLVTFAFVRNLSLAFLQVPLDPREGWNAYHAAAAFGGRLYPVFPSMMFNNYPPVSFLLVGGLGKLIGDNIVAGRLLALISTAGTALCVGAAARSMGAGRSKLRCPRCCSSRARGYFRIMRSSTIRKCSDSFWAARDLPWSCAEPATVARSRPVPCF